MRGGWYQQGRAARQRGSVPVFFVAFVLPLAFFLLSLSLDVGSYFSERASTQKVLDDTAMYAYRFLPYQSQAQTAATQYLSRYGPVASGVTVSFPTDGVELRASRTFPLLFATFLGLGNVGLPLELSARVRGVPFDLYISLDTTDTVAPPQIQTGAPWNLWGDINSWPASNYFSQLRFGPAGSQTDSRRALTQQCFNPTFAGLKRGAIQVLDYIGGFALNSVGVGVDNGNYYDPVEIVRTVRGSLPLPQQSSASQDAQFIQFTNNLVSNADCAAVAEAQGAADQHRVPAFPGSLPTRGDFTNRPSTLVNSATGQINTAYLPYLQAREVLWSQVARGPAGGSTDVLLLNAFGRLMSAPPVPGRKGLLGATKKVMLFFASDLPKKDTVVFGDSNDTTVRTALSNALTTSIFPYASSASTAGTSGRVELIYVLLQSPDTPNRSSRADALQSFFDTALNNANLTQAQFNARVIYVQTPDQLTQQVLAALALLNKTAVVSL